MQDIAMSCVGAWHSCDKHTSYGPLKIRLPQLNRAEKRYLLETGSHSFDNIPWYERCCSCTERSKGRTRISQPPPSECGNAVGKKDPAALLGWHSLQPDQAHRLGTHSTTYCLCLAHSSCSARGQKLPQLLRSWICSNTLLLMEKTTTCSFQSSQLVRNNNTQRGKKKHKALSTTSLSFSHTELRSLY